MERERAKAESLSQATEKKVYDRVMATYSPTQNLSWVYSVFFSGVFPFSKLLTVSQNLQMCALKWGEGKRGEDQREAFPNSS